VIHITDTTVFDESEIQERVVRAAIELRLDLASVPGDQSRHRTGSVSATPDRASVRLPRGGPGVVKRHRRASPGQEKSPPVMKNPRLVAWPAEQG